MFHKLIIGIMLLALSFAMSATADEKQGVKDEGKTAVSEKRYPPYPDVWDWQITEADKSIDSSAAPIVWKGKIPKSVASSAPQIIRVKMMDDGDVMIAYELDVDKRLAKHISFFGKTVISNPEDVYKGDYTSDAKSRIPFKNVFFLKTTGGGMRSDGCDDMLGYYIDVYDKDKRTSLESKRLLYVFDKPKYYKTIPYCMDGPSFYYQVKAVDAKFLPLKDGTFLLIADDGYIIRFDENFQTKSKLMNDKFFWMDTTELEVFKANAPRKFVKKYNDQSVIDIIDWKRLYADLYKLLMSKKRGGK